MTKLSTAHDKDPRSLMWRPVVWREPDEIRPYRTCSYCGGIHPEDFLTKLEAGSKAHLADLKYGWPHKFYGSGMEKFYSLHMLDANPETFAKLVPHLSDAGVDFQLEDGHLLYRAHMPKRSEP